MYVLYEFHDVYARNKYYFTEEVEDFLYSNPELMLVYRTNEGTILVYYKNTKHYFHSPFMAFNLKGPICEENPQGIEDSYEVGFFKITREVPSYFPAVDYFKTLVLPHCNTYEKTHGYLLAVDLS